MEIHYLSNLVFYVFYILYADGKLGRYGAAI